MTLMQFKLEKSHCNTKLDPFNMSSIYLRYKSHLIVFFVIFASNKLSKLNI